MTHVKINTKLKALTKAKFVNNISFELIYSRIDERPEPKAIPKTVKIKKN